MIWYDNIWYYMCMYLCKSILCHGILVFLCEVELLKTEHGEPLLYGRKPKFSRTWSANIEKPGRNDSWRQEISSSKHLYLGTRRLAKTVDKFEKPQNQQLLLHPLQVRLLLGDQHSVHHAIWNHLGQVRQTNDPWKCNGVSQHDSTIQRAFLS